LEAALHKTVNRPATVRQVPAAAPVRVAPASPAQLPGTAPVSRKLESPYTARFADAIAQMNGRAAAREVPDGFYRTGDGKLVELPDGVTAQDAAKLEAEAKAAEKKLGQGPPPKPVPDVKKLLPKPAKKEAPKPHARAGKAARAKDKAAAGAAMAAAAGLLRAVGSSKVAQYLAQRGAPALRTGIVRLSALKQNEQTHDTAGDKLHQSENAVRIPDSEGHSKSNAAQVTTVDGRPAPVADEKKAKGTLQTTLADNVPRTIEDVDNFKRDQKAQHVGADVLKVVQGDSNAVTSTFEDVTHAPLPAPPEHKPQDLPPEEVAPATAQMNLGQGAIAPLQNEHTDVSNFTKEADGKLKEEGVTQEQLDMVDSGDLAAANQEKKGLDAKAKTEPLAVQRFAVQEAQAVDHQLRQEEKTDRDRMRAKRKEALLHTGQKQKGTQSALEKKRDEVAAKINGKYKTAQDKVKKKLADLETDSMKRFDDGNAAASKAFEDNVNRELDAYKDDRYSGWFGWARRAKDWLLGMDELPGVKAIFDRNRQIFVDTINRLTESITADQKRVIQECKDELANAKKDIKEYVDSLEPSLKDIGQKAAQEMTEKLNALDQLVDRKQEELQNKLKDKQAAAIKAIDEKIEKMKEAMSGALAKLGKLLLLAAKKFFKWALEKCGVALSTIESIIDKGIAVLKAIFTGPIQFVKNLVRAAITGFQNFKNNFLKHLKDAVFEWLTGSLQGLVLPETWNLRGVLSIVFQMLGITYANFRAHLVALIPEPAVKALETTFTLVKTLVTEGPMAAWEQLKEIAGELQDAFVEAIKDWIKWKVVEEAVKTILAMFIPGAGIIRAIIGIYDTIVFFIQRAKDIMQMIGNFLSSIAEIAAGNIAAAADALENGLARGLVLVIDFLARFLRLSGITKRIQAAIENVRGKVNGVMAKVAAWAVAQAKKLGKLVVQAGVPQDPAQRLRMGMQAALGALRRISGSRVGRAVISPVLAGIRLRYGFTSLEPEVRNGRWWIRGRINPEDAQESDKFDVPSPSTKYTIQRLLNIANKAGMLSKKNANNLKKEIRAYCQMVDRPENTAEEKKARRRTQGEIPDPERAKNWTSLTGAIRADFVEMQEVALRGLRLNLEGTQALFGLERGGSMVADQLARGTSLTPTHIPKPTEEQMRQAGARDETEARKLIMVPALIDGIRQIMAPNPTAAMIIAVASAFVGGGETGEIKNALNRLLESGDYPNLEVRILALQLTLGHPERVRKRAGTWTVQEDKVHITYSSVRIIVAEDVGYQLLRTGEDSRLPVIVFKATANLIAAYQLTPTEGGRARDIVMDLTAGALRGRLPGVL
jgi:hypothetical protein